MSQKREKKSPSKKKTAAPIFDSIKNTILRNTIELNDAFFFYFRRNEQQ